MAKKENKITKRRLRSSYITTIISISLVLLLLGIDGLLMLNAKKLSDHVKENILFSVFIKDDVKDVEVKRLQKILDTKYYVKTTEYISKSEAARQWEEELGEEFVDFLEFNPLSSSIEVYLHAKYANVDSIAMIEADLSGYPQVKEINYQKDLVHIVNNNVKRISIFIIGFSAILFFIAITLINNTIRLAVYARRFIINTMQLVGATKSFIRRPFLYTSILHGIVGALIAIGLIIGLVFLVEKELGGVITIKDYEILGILSGGILILGILINWLSTFFAVNKYLRMHVDRLYY